MTRVRSAFWAGLGHNFGKDAVGKTAAEALAVAGMDWKVETRPLFTQLPTGEFCKAPANGVVRMTDDKVLGVVGPKYKVIQNGQSLGGLDALSANGQVEFSRAWELRGGSLVILQAKIPGKIVLPGNDEIEQYLLYVTSHDGSINTRVMLTPYRLFCSNQLNGVFGRYGKGKAQAGFAVRHTVNADRKLEQGVKLLGQARQAFEWFGDRAKEFTQIKFGEANLRRFVQAMFPTPVDDNGKEKEVPTQTQNARLKVLELFETGAGSDAASARGTAWGAYNALTEYVDHERGTRSADEDQRGVKRLESIWFGSGAALKTRAWEYLLDNKN